VRKSERISDLATTPTLPVEHEAFGDDLYLFAALFHITPMRDIPFVLFAKEPVDHVGQPHSPYIHRYIVANTEIMHS